MKTKPHGCVNENYEMELARTGTLTVSLDTTPQGEPATTFICLINPATCDKVRKFLQNVESGVGYTRQQAAELLKLLPEVGE